MEQAQRDDEVLQLLIIPGAASTFEACHSIRPEAAGATGQRQASASAGAPCTPCPRLSSWAASPVPGDESQRSWPEPRRRHLGPCRHLGRTGALGPSQCLACGLRRVSQRAGAGAGSDPLAPTSCGPSCGVIVLAPNCGVLVKLLVLFGPGPCLRHGRDRTGAGPAGPGGPESVCRVRFGRG